MSGPAVTVLMAVYDPPVPLLEQAVNSILGQTNPDFEFLIVDDGSQGAAVQEYLARIERADRRILVAHEPHRGLTRSLNRGLALSRGPWIARQDADDWSEPQRIERQLDFIAAHPGLQLCGSNAWIHQQNGRRLWKTNLPRTHSEILNALRARNPFVHGATIFSRGQALRVGGYREALLCSQDYDLFWRLAETGEAANLEGAWYHYRYTAGSISAGRAAEQAIAHRAAQILAAHRAASVFPGCEERRAIPGDVDGALMAARQGLSASSGHRMRSQLKQADHLLLAGHYLRALQAYLRLVALRPGSALAWAKLARLGVFLAAPALRQECFR